MITSSAHIAAYISAFFARVGEYLVVMDAPAVGRPELTHNRLVRTTNVIAAVRPEVVVLGPMTDAERRAIKDRLGGTRVVDVRTPEEAAKKLGLQPDEPHSRFLAAPEGELPRLLWELRRYQEQPAEDLVCLESRSPLLDLSIANLAVALGADFRNVDIPTDVADAIRSEQEFIRGVTRAAEGLKQPKLSTLPAYHEVLQLHKYHTVTFVTHEIPHGLVIPKNIICAHLPSIVDLPRVLPDIINSELVEAERTYTAILCDPGFFPDSETTPVSRLLTAAGWHVRHLEGAQASFDKFHNHLQFFPHDFLLAVAHGGRVPGQYQVWRLEGDDGQPHTFEAEVVMTVGDVRPDEKVHLSFLTVPVRVDGIFWSDDQGKKAIGAGKILQRYIDLHGDGPSAELQLMAAYDLPDVAHSNAILLHGGATHFLGVHALGFREHPVLFNNSCSSWDEMGGRALHAGARAYICTGRAVDDRDATSVAIRFVDLALQGTPLAQALTEATRDLPRERDPYLYVGLPFSTMRAAPAGVVATDRWRRRLVKLYRALTSRLNEVAGDDSVAENRKLAENLIRARLFIQQVARELS